MIQLDFRGRMKNPTSSVLKNPTPTPPKSPRLLATDSATLFAMTHSDSYISVISPKTYLKAAEH